MCVHVCVIKKFLSTEGNKQTLIDASTARAQASKETIARLLKKRGSADENPTPRECFLKPQQHAPNGARLCKQLLSRTAEPAC